MASFLVCFSHAGASINIKPETRKRFWATKQPKTKQKTKKDRHAIWENQSVLPRCPLLAGGDFAGRAGLAGLAKLSTL